MKCENLKTAVCPKCGKTYHGTPALQEAIIQQSFVPTAELVRLLKVSV